MSAGRAWTPTDQDLLRPYVPRMVVDWLRATPQSSYREVEGTLAFVDISGFTRLTERLARKGRIGAEEMSDTLSTIFTGLLGVAYEDGAGLVKWGGDAVLLLFDGDAHAARAARAAVRMRGALRELGKVDTSAGRLQLRMSVGIHSGTFHFFLVGDPALHRELLVSGPAASTTAEIEALTGAGQVGLSRQTAEALPERIVRPGPEGIFLLRSEPSVPAWPAPSQPDTAGLDLGSTLSAPVRAHLLGGGGEPEHRHIAVAFVQFSGTDELLRASGPQRLADALDECVRNVQEAADRHGVTFFETDINKDGGKIMLVAGAPTSAGANEERMLLATRLILDRPGALPLRIGVNSGPVFSGDFGPTFRRTYSVKGDAVNLAARVMGRASPGQLLATTGTLARSRTSFDTEPLAPFMVKGKAKPVEAASVGPARHEARPHDVDLPLVGREVEMGVLTGALDSARSRHGVVVELVGEPGIGKSRLVDELTDRAADVDVFFTACDEYESSTAYYPFRSLLREVCGLPVGSTAKLVLERLVGRVAAEDPDLVPWLPLLGIPLDVELPATEATRGLDEKFRKAKVEDVCVRFLEATLPTAALLVFDDVHWMDDVSADLLQQICGRAPMRPWLVLLTRRDVESGFVPDSDDVVRLRPAPIEAALALSLVEESMQDAPLPPHTVAAIAERAGGNPLFLRSLLTAARTGGVTGALPESVEGLVTSQIDRLTADERALLRFASVLGVSFAEDQLRQMLGEDDRLPTGRGTMQRLGEFLEPAGHGRFRFHHALIRDAAYEGLSYRRRRELHGRVGELLESGSDPEDQAELLSMHYFYAGRSDKAWHYSRVAGERSRAKYAYVEATEFFGRAVASARRLPELDARVLADVYEAMGDAHMLVGDNEDARRSYRAARKVAAADPVHEAHLLLQEAKVDLHQGRPQQCLRLVTRGLHRLSADGEPAEMAMRARLEFLYSFTRVRQGRYGEAVKWGHRAEQHALAATEKRALAEVYGVMQGISTFSRFAHERPYGEMALTLYEELGDLLATANIVNNLAAAAFFDGLWSDALAMYARARDDYARVGHQLGVITTEYNRAEILSRQGYHGEAESQLRWVRSAAEGFGEQDLAATAVRELGRLLVQTDRLKEGRELLDTAHVLFVALGEHSEVLATDVEIAAGLLADGDLAAALAACDAAKATAVKLAVDAMLPTIGRVRGAVLLALGRVEEARDELEAALAISGQQGSYEAGFIQMVLAQARTLLGDPSAPQTRADGLRLLQSLGVRASAAAEF